MKNNILIGVKLKENDYCLLLVCNVIIKIYNLIVNSIYKYIESSYTWCSV